MLDKYESLEILRVNLPFLHHLRLSSNMRNMRVLRLDGATAQDFNVDESLDVFQKMSGATALSLSLLGKNSHPFNVDTFWKLLNVFQNVRFFDLFLCLCAPDPERLRTTLPHLQGLGIYGGYRNVVTGLVEHLGDKLRHLTMCCPVSDLSTISHQFSNLQGLRLVASDYQRIRSIIKDTLKVKQCGIYPYMKGVPPPTGQELKLAIAHILKSCKQLEYLEFESSIEHLTFVMDGIEDGIIDTSNWARPALRIRVAVLDIGAQTMDIKSITKHIGRVVHWLERSETNDFVFTLDVEAIRALIDCDELLNSMMRILKMVTVKRSGCVFDISNNTRIGVPENTWMMDLVHLPPK